MLKIGRVNSLQLRLLTTSRLSGARGGQRRAEVEPTKKSKDKIESAVKSIKSNGVPYITTDLSSNAKVILCNKLHKDLKPAEIAAAFYNYGAQKILNSLI